MKVVIKVIRILSFGKLAIVNFLGRFDPSLELNLLKSIQFDPAQIKPFCIYIFFFCFCGGLWGGGVEQRG